MPFPMLDEIMLGNGSYCDPRRIPIKRFEVKMLASLKTSLKYFLHNLLL